MKRKQTAGRRFFSLHLMFRKNLQSAVVEEHHKSVFSLHPLEQQRGRTRDLLPTEKIPTLEEGEQEKNVTLISYPTLLLYS